MAGATIWKGYIHFRETDVAVKLHSATGEERIRFHLLHAADRARLRQQMICSVERLPAPAEEQSRGFEVEEGKYLIIDPEELEQLVPESSRMIEVREFVKSEQIDPLFVDRVYYLEPDKTAAGENPYSTLARIMTEQRVAGICTWSMRKRGYLGALQAAGGSLRLCALRYADEVVPAAELGLPHIAVSEKELRIGSELINQLSGPFEPRKFVNEHEQRLQDMIDRKARGENIIIRPPKQLEPTPPDNLLEVLEAGLKKAA